MVCSSGPLNVSITVLSYFDPKLRTFGRSLKNEFLFSCPVGDWLLNGFSIACIIRKSNNKSYCVCSVSVVNQKLLFRKFQGENKCYLPACPWLVCIEKNSDALMVLNVWTLACPASVLIFEALRQTYNPTCHFSFHSSKSLSSISS